MYDFYFAYIKFRIMKEQHNTFYKTKGLFRNSELLAAVEAGGSLTHTTQRAHQNRSAVVTIQKQSH